MICSTTAQNMHLASTTENIFFWKRFLVSVQIFYFRGMKKPHITKIVRQFTPSLLVITLKSNGTNQSNELAIGI